MTEVRVIHGPPHVVRKIGWLHEPSKHIYIFPPDVPSPPGEGTIAVAAAPTYHCTYVKVTANDKKKAEKGSGHTWYDG